MEINHNKFIGAGKMAHQLRTFVALSKTQVQFPAHTQWFTTVTPVLEDSTPSSCPRRDYILGIQTYMQAKYQYTQTKRTLCVCMCVVGSKTVSPCLVKGLFCYIGYLKGKGKESPYLVDRLTQEKKTCHIFQQQKLADF